MKLSQIFVILATLSAVNIQNCQSQDNDYSFPFAPNSRDFQEWLHDNNPHIFPDGTRYVFQKIRDCSSSYTTTLDRENIDDGLRIFQVYKCTNSSYQKYQRTDQWGSSGRQDCLHGGTIYYAAHPDGDLYGVRGKGCNTWKPRDFPGSPQSFVAYLNKVNWINKDRDVHFHNLYDCDHIENGLIFRCKGGNVTLTGWEGARRCQVKHASYNESTRKSSYEYGWCRSISLLEQPINFIERSGDNIFNDLYDLVIPDKWKL